MSGNAVMRETCPWGGLSAHAAARVVRELGPALPDGTGAVVLLPSLRAAGDFAAALREAAARPLLLPRITTLQAWAADQPLPRRVATRAEREVAVCAALAQRQWLDTADLWSIAAELCDLVDELTRHAVELPASPEAFVAQIERAYRMKRGEALQFEARLVHEFWRVLAADTEALDPCAARGLRLSAIAAAAKQPLYVIGLGRLDRGEQAFLEQYALRAPVLCLDEAALPDAGGVAGALAEAWCAPGQAEGALKQRALRLKDAQPQSALAGRLRLFGAASLEQEAQAIDVTLRQWLLAGHRRIGVIVNDRTVARRARALLERAGVLVRDEAGWPFSTTSAATAIGRWLDVVSGDAYHRDLLDLLKLPFAFHDWPRATRQATVWRIERAVRGAGVISGIRRTIELAEASGDAEARQMLASVQIAMQAMAQRRRRTLAQWLQTLSESLAVIGVRAGLAADEAGRQLLELLQGLQAELAASTLQVDFASWRRWLSRALESAAFVDLAIDSPVVFTGIEAARLREFDALLVLGADAMHLPGDDRGARFFNQGVRAQLGLPTREHGVRDIELALGGLVAAAGEVLITWQSSVGGEPNLPSPLVERLRALHQLAYGIDLADTDLAARVAAAQLRVDDAPLPGPGPAPRPAAPAARLPAALSASAHNALMACPYQFFPRYVLGLGEFDEVQELIEKADYGRIVHEVLHGFHRDHREVSAIGLESACAVLERRSEEAFAAALARSPLALAWLERWRMQIPGYVGWQLEREAGGWRWHDGEAQREIALTTPAGAPLRLRGRLDRIDCHADGHTEVIDYKTRAENALKQQLKTPGEDVQLAVYALLWEAPVTAAQYLSLERDGVTTVPLPQPPQQAAAAVRERLLRLFDAMRAGAPLPAQGVQAACKYCEMRGLCRRGHWS